MNSNYDKIQQNQKPLVKLCTYTCAIIDNLHNFFYSLKRKESTSDFKTSADIY